MNSRGYKKFIDKKTLIIGPLRAGKTRLLSSILFEFIEAGLEKDIIILDFSPDEIEGLGGPLSRYIDVSRMIYLAPDNVWPPRLMGKTEEEVDKLAEENRRVLEKFVDMAIKIDKQILFINDVTLYLHRGSLSRILRLFDSKRTVIATAYYGDEFDDKGSGINVREKVAVRALMIKADNVIRLGSVR